VKLIAFDVVDAGTNKPIAGVRLVGRVMNQQRTWVTGEDGQVTLDVDGGAKTLSISATADGYVPTIVTWAAAPRGEGIPGEYLLRLERGTTIGGRVVDEAGQPVAGADVGLFLERKGQRSVGPTMLLGERVQLYNVHVKTDPEGYWHFDQAPARMDPARVQLSHPDFLSDELPGQRTAPPEEKLRDRSSVMVMVKGVTVAGRVTDPAGNPVAGARVSLGMNRYGHKSPTGKTGADGRYELAHCRPGQPAALVVVAKGLAPYMAEFALDEKGATRDVALAVARPMRVRVVNAKGEPVAGATVSAGAWRMLEVLEWRGTTDGEGRVTWVEAPTDPVGLNASAPGYVSVMERSVLGGDAEHVIKLVKILVVSGTVVDDETGKPVTGFRAVGGWTSAGRPAPFWSRDEGGVNYGPAGTGAFDFRESFQRDGYAVRVESAGYLPVESREIKPGEEDVKLEFRLKKGKDLVATLRSVDGKPLAGADVLLVNASSQIMVTNGKPTTQTFTLKTKADGAGKFRMDPQAGKFSVMVLHDLGYATLSPADLAKGDAVIVVRPWGTVRGTAWVGDKPAAGRTIVAMTDMRQPGVPRLDCNAVVDGRGQFILDRVPPGPLLVGIEVRTQVNQTMWNVTWTQRKQVDAVAGQAVEVKLGGEGRIVVGKLHVVQGEGPAGKTDWQLAAVRLTSKMPAGPKLPADWLKMSQEAREAWNQEWMKSPAGMAFSKAQVERRSYPAKVAADGTFRADGVEPGTYTVDARVNVRPADGGDALATGRGEVTVPGATGGTRRYEPVDAGVVELRG
jgi:hypothetical protein